MYFTGYAHSNKAYLDTNILETNKQIEVVINGGTPYIGGYRGLDNKVVLENILGFKDTFNVDTLWNRLAQNEESVYKCHVVSKVKIGSFSDKKYLIATVYDLMCSLVEPMQGFTIENDGIDLYLLICSQGEYIMNPNYNKESQNESK